MAFFVFAFCVVGFGKVLGVASPFFSGILLSRKPPKTLGKRLVFERTMAEKNGESTTRKVPRVTSSPADVEDVVVKVVFGFTADPGSINPRSCIGGVKPSLFFSLSGFMGVKLFAKTVLVVNNQFGHFDRK